MADSRRRARRSHGRGRQACAAGRSSGSRLGLLLVVVLLGAFMGWQAWSAYRSAQAANNAIGEFRARLLDRDVAGAEEALGRAQEETRTARSSLAGPLWGAATLVPVVGDDVDAARRLTTTADDVAQGALPAVMTALSYVDPRDIGLRNGKVELDPLRDASGQLTRASVLLAEADEDAAAISTDGLVPRAAHPGRGHPGPARPYLAPGADRVARGPAAARHARRGRSVATTFCSPRTRPSSGRWAASRAPSRCCGPRTGGSSWYGRPRPRTSARSQRPVLPLSKAEEALYGTVLGRFPPTSPTRRTSLERPS